MRIEIKINSQGDKELYINDSFQASWDKRVNDKDTIIPYALDCAYELGRKSIQKEFKKLLGLYNAY